MTRVLRFRRAGNVQPRAATVAGRDAYCCRSRRASGLCPCRVSMLCCWHNLSELQWQVSVVLWRLPHKCTACHQWVKDLIGLLYLSVCVLVVHLKWEAMAQASCFKLQYRPTPVTEFTTTTVLQLFAWACLDLRIYPPIREKPKFLFEDEPPRMFPCIVTYFCMLWIFSYICTFFWCHLLTPNIHPFFNCVFV